jgi:hypothetical protein
LPIFHFGPAALDDSSFSGDAQNFIQIQVFLGDFAGMLNYLCGAGVLLGRDQTQMALKDVYALEFRYGAHDRDYGIAFNRGFEDL